MPLQDRYCIEHVLNDVWNNLLNGLRVIQSVGLYTNKTYEDTSFVVGESPKVLDFNSDTGRNAVDGYIICDGAGNITVDFSLNGTTYGDKATLKTGEVLDLAGLDIDSLRITHTGTDSSYRAYLV